MIANTEIIPHTYIPQPLNGINSPLLKYDIQSTPIGLVINVIQKNVENFIFVIPAIKHNISSGNIGSRNANTRNTGPLFLMISEYFSVLSLPTIHDTILYPNVLPNKNDIYDPISTPIEQ